MKEVLRKYLSGTRKRFSLRKIDPDSPDGIPILESDFRKDRPASAGQRFYELSGAMSRAMKIIPAFLAASAFVLFQPVSAIQVEVVKETCPRGMVPIPAGEFVMGTTEPETEYLFNLCKQTMGGCYLSWFQRETPREIVYIPPFCIDRFEYPNIPGTKPQTSATWETAAASCREQRKILCSESQWERACAGPDNHVWSFGDPYVAGECNIKTNSVEPSGSRKNCFSFDGVYDMNGNVAEWVYARPGAGARPRPEGGRLLKGGRHSDWPIFTRCSFRDFRPMGDQNRENGFRCCAPLIERERQHD
jgi:formylglycine-generating enzyme required for sulfatase activity